MPQLSRRLKVIITGLLSCSLVVVAILWLRSGLSLEAAPPKATRAPSTFPLPNSSLGLMGNPPASTPDDALLAQFKQTRSAVEFIEAAKRQPGSSGYVAAHYIARYCTARRHLLDRVNAEVARTESSYARLEKPPLVDAFCAGVPEVDPQSQLAMLRQGGQVGDRHASELAEVLQNPLSGTGTVQAILRKNPFEAVFADDWLWVNRNSGSDGTTVYFDDQWQDTQRSAALRFASMLVACEKGFPCGPDRLEVLAQCRLSGDCFSNYPDLVTYWAAQAGVSTAELQAALHELVAKLSQGDTRGFIPQKRVGG